MIAIPDSHSKFQRMKVKLNLYERNSLTYISLLLLHIVLAERRAQADSHALKLESLSFLSNIRKAGDHKLCG